MSQKFRVGDAVRIVCRGHRHDGRTGQVSYIGLFGNIGVSIDGDDYGFMPFELDEALQ